MTGEISPVGEQHMGKYSLLRIFHTGDVTIQQRGPAGSVLKSAADLVIGVAAAGAWRLAPSSGKN